MTRQFHGIVAAALLSSAPLAHADPVVTAEWVDASAPSYGSFGGPGFSQARGQTFEATEEGRVVSIDLHIARNFDHSEPLVIEVFDTGADGRPMGDPLMSQPFPAETIPDDISDPVTRFVFDSGAMLLAGQTYAVVFRPQALDPEANNYVVRGGLNENATYEGGNALRSADGGATWIVATNADWIFRVSVEGATPIEHASWGVIKNHYR